MGKRAALVVLAVCLAAGLLTACSGPKAAAAATLKVTVKDEAGVPLADITVAAGGKTATTDAQGTATFPDLTPGTVTVKLGGQGYEPAEQSATVQPGENSLACEMRSAALVVRDPAGIAGMRLRIAVESAGESYETEAELAASGDSRWTGDGTTVIVKDQVLYVRADGQWMRFDGDLGRNMAEVYLGVSRAYMNEFFDFSADLSAPGAHIGKFVGQEEANTYSCNVYAVTWPGLPQDLSYKVWVIASGAWRGYITRYRCEQTGVGLLVIDVWDFNAEISIEAPI